MPRSLCGGGRGFGRRKKKMISFYNYYQIFFNLSCKTFTTLMKWLIIGCNQRRIPSLWRSSNNTTEYSTFKSSPVYILVCSPHTQPKTCQYQFWRESLYTQNNECRTIVSLSRINSLFFFQKMNICGVNKRMFYNKTVSKSGAITHNSSVPSFLLKHTSTQCQRITRRTMQYKGLCWTYITK